MISVLKIKVGAACISTLQISKAYEWGVPSGRLGHIFLRWGAR